MGRRGVLLVVGLLLAAAVVVALLATSRVLTPFVERRLSDALGVPVAVTRIAFSPSGPTVTLHGIALRQSADAAPVATLGTLSIDIAARRCLRGDWALDAIELDEPWVDLQRTADGDLNLATLFARDGAADDAAAAPPPSAAAAPAAAIEIDAFRIRNGTVEFHDATVTPPVATTAYLDRADADNLHLNVAGDADIAVTVKSRLGEDPLNLELGYRAQAANSDLRLSFDTTGASLARILVHAGLGWTQVAGTVDAQAEYRRTVAAGALTSHRLTLAAHAHDLALADAAIGEPTFRADDAWLRGLTIDLIEQQIALGDVEATGYQALVFRTDTGVYIPFATGSASAEPSAWTTILGEITLGEGVLLLRDLPPGAPEVTAEVRKGRIADDDGAVTFAFDTNIADGTLDIDGRVIGDTTTVTLALAGLSAPQVAAHLALPVALASGTLSGKIEGRFADGPATFHGRLTAADIKSAPSAEHPEEVFAWATLELTLADSTVAPPHLHVTDAKLAWPYLMLHRRNDGVYPFTGTGAGAPVGNGAPAAEALVVVDRAAIVGGRIEFYDTVLPKAWGTELVELAGTIEDLRIAPLSVADFTLDGSIDELSPASARGQIAPTAARVHLTVDRLLLPPLTPYLEPGLRYEVTNGLADIDADIQRRAAALTADNELQLSRLALRSSGADPFKGELGVALPVALSLMKDSRGRIQLDLPVELDLETQEYELSTSVLGALRQAFLGALQSPVKLLAAILLRNDGEEFDLKPVPFTAGRAELDDTGTTRVGQLARLLERHASLRLVLLPHTSQADAEALAASDAGAEAAETLARTRAAAITRVLVEDYGVAETRVRSRRPERHLDAATAPGVDVQLKTD